MRRLTARLCAILSISPIAIWPMMARAEGLAVEPDAATGWSVYKITHGNSEVRLVPQAGFNVHSWRIGDVELLRQPPTLARLPGVGYGVPVLYPTPNRIRGAAFEFEGQRFTFPDNNNGNFIHGLVHSVPWRIVGIKSTDGSTEITGQVDFGGEAEPLARFPLAHAFQIKLTVTDRSIRWTYTVDNRAGQRAVPFGFALHPYFNYASPRESTRIRVPATHVMEAEQLLPTGKLVPLDGHPLDARQPRLLSDLRADDVYFGMRADAPTEIELLTLGTRLVLKTSPEFTHLVLYTPNQPYFCVENQTCSTDAHNMHASGHIEAAHLQICPAGETRGGWVEYVYSQ